MGSAALPSNGSSGVRRTRSLKPCIKGDLLPGLSESPNCVRGDPGRSWIHRVVIVDPISENFEIAPIRCPNGSHQRQLAGTHGLQHVVPTCLRGAWGEQARKLTQLSNAATGFGAQSIAPAIIDWRLVGVADFPRVNGFRRPGGRVRVGYIGRVLRGFELQTVLQCHDEHRNTKKAEENPRADSRDEDAYIAGEHEFARAVCAL